MSNKTCDSAVKSTVGYQGPKVDIYYLSAEDVVRTSGLEEVGVQWSQEWGNWVSPDKGEERWGE